MVNFLYHGSKKQNLTKLIPSESGHKNKFVYAVSCEAFSAIFINRPGGSLVASWGRLKDKTPYFCERKKGILNKNYNSQSGSIYVVDKKYFIKKKGLWKEEYISNKKIPVIKEIKIINLKKYLKELEKKGKIKIIYYKDRQKYFPNIDNELMNVVKKLIKKYGLKRILPNLKKYQPSIVKQILKKEEN